METKKLSFGFNKVIKKTNLIPQSKVNIKNEDIKIELIKCIEDSSIKLIKEMVDIKPLVIPMKNSTKTSAALASLEARKAILEGVEVSNASANDKEQINLNCVNPSNETLDAKAARELLQEVRKQQNIETLDTSLILPLKSDTKNSDETKESNLDDYEAVPVQQFGLAMLRGMGWKDDPNSKKKSIDIEGPIQRPKGMGLGADKAIKKMPLLIEPEKNEKLEIKKNAYVRILAGKHKNFYGQIEGLDDHAGRVIIKLVIGGEKISLNEFLVQPVSKAEFQKHGKIINSTKYEEYKKFENDKGQIIVPKNYEKSHTSTSKDVIKQEYHSRSDKYKSNRSTTPSEINRSRSDKKYSDKIIDCKYDSSRDRYKKEAHDDSYSSESSESRHHHKAKKTKKKSNKIKKYYRNDSSEDEKKHKKKTKKSKRERSRSRSRSRTRK